MVVCTVPVCRTASAERVSQHLVWGRDCVRCVCICIRISDGSGRVSRGTKRRGKKQSIRIQVSPIEARFSSFLWLSWELFFHEGKPNRSTLSCSGVKTLLTPPPNSFLAARSHGDPATPALQATSRSHQYSTYTTFHGKPGEHLHPTSLIKTRVPAARGAHPLGECNLKLQLNCRSVNHLPRLSVLQLYCRAQYCMYLLHQTFCCLLETLEVQKLISYELTGVSFTQSGIGSLPAAGYPR